jgi:hypothetical protein
MPNKVKALPYSISAMFHDELDNICYDEEFRIGYLHTYILFNVDI